LTWDGFPGYDVFDGKGGALFEESSIKDIFSHNISERGGLPS